MGPKGPDQKKSLKSATNSTSEKATKKWFEMGFVLARISGLQALEHKPNAKEERTKRNREGSRQEGANHRSLNCLKSVNWKWNMS